MTLQNKINLSLGISAIALIVAVFSLFLGGKTTSQAAGTPAEFLKNVAKEAGLKSKAFDQCVESTETRDLVNRDIAEAERIAESANLPGLGTPLNILVSKNQVLIVSGAYPEEIFDTLINQIKTVGTVDKETLDSFMITEAGYSLTQEIRAFDESSDHYRGNTNAEITIYEYSDLQCPYCRQLHPTLKNISEKYDDVLWVYRHLPLNIHPQAMPAALAAKCVAEEKGNDAFWQFADEVFENQDQLN